MGFTVKRFDFTTPRELWYSFKAIAKERDRRTRANLESMRLQTLYLVNLQLGDKAIKDPRALMPFEWDDEYIEEVYIPTPEEWEEMDRKYVKKDK